MWCVTRPPATGTARRRRPRHPRSNENRCYEKTLLSVITDRRARCRPVEHARQLPPYSLLTGRKHDELTCEVIHVRPDQNCVLTCYVPVGVGLHLLPPCGELHRGAHAVDGRRVTLPADSKRTIGVVPASSVDTRFITAAGGVGFSYDMTSSPRSRRCRRCRPPGSEPRSPRTRRGPRGRGHQPRRSDADEFGSRKIRPVRAGSRRKAPIWTSTKLDASSRRLPAW